MLNIVSVIITSISIIVTIWYAKKERKVSQELQKLRGYIDFKRMEEFSLRYRDGLNSYRKRVTSAKWNEIKKGRDIVGEMDGLLIEFNTFLPKIDIEKRQRIRIAIDDAQKEFAKVRKGDEDTRDSNIILLGSIDRLLNEEIETQRNSYRGIFY